VFHINALRNIYANVAHRHTYTDKIFNVILSGFYLFNLGNFCILSVLLYSTLMIVAKVTETLRRILIYVKLYFISVHLLLLACKYK
jgi:hypothetical protein